MGGGVGQADRAVGGTYDDGLAHRADDGIQFRRPGMLGLGESLQADLDLDPLADIPGDGDDPTRSIGQLDWLGDELDRDRAIALETQL